MPAYPRKKPFDVIENMVVNRFSEDNDKDNLYLPLAVQKTLSAKRYVEW